nr:hypothetical protein [Candidatus Saccharibacteria bacterium]
WKQDSEDNGSLVRLTNYACDLHQTKGSIPQNLIKSFNNSPRERAFRAGKKIQKIMGWGKEKAKKVSQTSTQFKLGATATLASGALAATLSDKTSALYTAAFVATASMGTIPAMRAIEGATKWWNNSSRSKKFVVIGGIGLAALAAFGVVGSMRYGGTGGGGGQIIEQGKEVVKNRKPKAKGPEATQVIHDALTSTSPPKPKSQSTTVAEFIPKGSGRGSGSSAAELIPTPTGKTTSTATTKVARSATTVATELKPGAETTQRTTKAAEKSGEAFQKAQELRFKIGMGNQENKIRRRIRALERAKGVKEHLSAARVTKMAKEINQGNWENFNSPGATERYAQMTPSGSSQMLDHVISQKMALAA